MPNQIRLDQGAGQTAIFGGGKVGSRLDDAYQFVHHPGRPKNADDRPGRHPASRPLKLVEVASSSSTITKSPGSADDGKLTGLFPRVRPITSPARCRLGLSTITSITWPNMASLRSLPHRCTFSTRRCMRLSATLG